MVEQEDGSQMGFGVWKPNHLKSKKCPDFKGQGFKWLGLKLKPVYAQPFDILLSKRLDCEWSDFRSPEYSPRRSVVAK